jgi:hypothetical protein
MTYETHLRAVLEALFAAAPYLSRRAVAREAGLHPQWIGKFLGDGKASFASAEKVLAAVARLAPQGPAGDPVRARLAALDLDSERSAA